MTIVPEATCLPPHDWVPNHPTLPVLVYRQAIVGGDSAAAMEARFADHAWQPQWRDGIYDFHHYHSTAHEALGIAAGSARLVLGGPGGRETTVSHGDVLLLPAGTGHRCLSATDDFLVVGAYPLGQSWDIRRDAPTRAILDGIRHLPFPDTDPVNGRMPPLTEHWPRR